MKAYCLNPAVGGGRGTRSYRFRGAVATYDWPIDEGRHLGTAGIWNFLWRIGVHSRDCTVDQLPPPRDAILWAHLDEGTEVDRLMLLNHWMAAGGYVVASGDAKAWSPILGWEVASWNCSRPENPYAGLAWQLPNRDAELIAPARWPVGVCRKAPAGAQMIGSIRAVQGERQTPGRALLVGLDAPAIVCGAHYCFLNGHPFAALQAWLQGQEDLQPWLGWRHRLFWLDEWVSTIADVLSVLPALPPQLPRPGIKGLDATTVILRHDVDHSRDTAYLEEEIRRGVRATHAVLNDRNAEFWSHTLAAHPEHECALHYNTGGRDWMREAGSRLKGAGAAPLQPRPAQVARRGLLQQVRWAQSHGIGVASLLRHLVFQVYPEWVDGLDQVFAEEATVLGASSMFRAQVLRWGAARVDGVAGTVGEFPDSQFPMWLPFKLAHAGRGGARLRGWESTSLIESEPELVDQMLGHRSRHLPQRVITLGYHPAHAHGTTFSASGGIASFRQVLDVIARHHVGIEPSRHVFALAHAAEARANGAN